MLDTLVTMSDPGLFGIITPVGFVTLDPTGTGIHLLGTDCLNVSVLETRSLGPPV